MSRRAIVYCYTSPSGKKYVGICYSDRENKRKSDHKTLAIRGYGYCFHNAIRKYGFDNFKYEVLCYVNDIETAKRMEIAIIKEMDLQNSLKGYNRTKGGDFGVPIIIGSEAHKKVIETTRKNMGVKVELYKRDVFISRFDSLAECSLFIKNVTGTDAKESTIRSKISDVLYGRRKSVYGFNLIKLESDF